MKDIYKLILSMFIFGTISIFVKNIPISSGEIALFRGLIGALTVITFTFLKKGRLSFPKRKSQLILCMLSGIALGFNWIFLFEAYKYTSVSIATLSYYFAPVIIIIVSTILFKEKFTVKKLVCSVMSTIGLVLIINISQGINSNKELFGIFLGIIAAFFYASIVILNKYIKDVSAVDRTVYQFGCSVLLLIPYVLITSGFKVYSLDCNGVINLLILGIVHTGVAYYLYFGAIKNLEGQKAAIMSYIDPLVAVIVSVFFLGEGIGYLQIIGGILILTFTLLNEINLEAHKKFKK